MVKLFRKKPLTVEAVQFKYNTEDIAKLKEFAGDALISVHKQRYMGSRAWAEIGTLEDGDKTTNQVKHIAMEGDWIVKGIKGEFWAVKPDIFELTYEEVYE